MTARTRLALLHLIRSPQRPVCSTSGGQKEPRGRNFALQPLQSRFSSRSQDGPRRDRASPCEPSASAATSIRPTRKPLIALAMHDARAPDPTPLLSARSSHRHRTSKRRGSRWLHRRVSLRHLAAYINWLETWLTGARAHAVIISCLELPAGHRHRYARIRSSAIAELTVRPFAPALNRSVAE